jgi:hypothetical protein
MSYSTECGTRKTHIRANFQMSVGWRQCPEFGVVDIVVWVIHKVWIRWTDLDRKAGCIRNRFIACRAVFESIQLLQVNIWITIFSGFKFLGGECEADEIANINANTDFQDRQKYEECGYNRHRVPLFPLRDETASCRANIY